MDVNKKVVQCRKYPITYTLVTKQVKNINMRISSKGEVVVSANPFVPMDKIDDFVSSKVSWIVKHQKSMQERSQKSMIDDKHIILFGNSLKIRKTTGKYNHVSYDKDTLYVQCSCTPAKNSITLNRKLIHYPFEFIEYVVLHEFVHFIQPNHSKAFYNIIENYMPDYKTRMEMVN